MDTARADGVDAEIDRLISKRASQDRRPAPDEREELWKASVRAYTARRREEMRAAWCSHHQGQAARLMTVLEELIADHEEQAERYREATGRTGMNEHKAGPRGRAAVHFVHLKK